MTAETKGRSRPYTGAEYLESLRDGREIWLYGERVKDVTTHPAFRNTARMIARLYDALHDPAKKDVLTMPTDTGNGGLGTKEASSNLPPVINGSIDDVAVNEGAVSFSISSGTFSDPENKPLAYLAEMADGTALPGWLSFTAGMLTFSGNADDAQVGGERRQPLVELKS